MVICVALDDNMGMLFNNRRQSQDKILRQHLLQISKKNNLWINNYTSKQFENPLADNIIVDDEFLDKATDNDYCFIENISIDNYKDSINKIIIFKWNRVYPSDTYFDVDLLKEGWKLTTTEDFKGSSHDKITKEEWNKWKLY